MSQRNTMEDFVALRNIKSKFDPDIERDRRFENNNNLRKRRREKELNKQRKTINEISDELSEDVMMLDMNNEKGTNLLKVEWIKALFSDQIYEQLGAAYKVSILLSRNKSSQVIDEIIKAGMVPKIFELIQSDNKQLQLRSAMALTDVSTQTIKEFLPDDAVAVLANLMENSENMLLNEYLITVLGNIVVESSELRDIFIASDVLNTLHRLVKSPSASVNMLRSCSWTLSVVCFRKDPVPDVQNISLCIHILVALVCRDDFDVISDSCWALSHLMSGCKSHIQTVIDSKICPRLVHLLNFRSSEKVILGALNAVGNVVVGTFVQTQIIIDCDPTLSALRNLLTDINPGIVKNACWVFSNIAAGNAEQIQFVIDATVYPTILDLLVNSTVETQREAGWTIRQAISRSRSRLNQVNYFVSIGTLPILSSLIHTTDYELLRVVLKSLRNILDFRVDEHFMEIRSLCDINHLQSLETHDDYDVQRFASHVLDYLIE